MCSFDEAYRYYIRLFSGVVTLLCSALNYAVIIKNVAFKK